MACISRFAAAILSGETEIALGTIRVKETKPNSIEGFRGTDTACVEFFSNKFASRFEIFVIPWDQILYPWVVRNVGWPPTALVIMHTLSTRYKWYAPATHHLLAHDVRPTDLTQLMMFFNRRYALCIQNLYHKPHFTIGGSWNKNLHSCNNATVRTREVPLVYASCDSCTRSRFRQ